MLMAPPYPIAVCGALGYPTGHSLRTYIGPTRNSCLLSELPLPTPHRLLVQPGEDRKKSTLCFSLCWALQEGDICSGCGKRAPSPGLRWIGTVGEMEALVGGKWPPEESPRRKDRGPPTSLLSHLPGQSLGSSSSHAAQVFTLQICF